MAKRELSFYIKLMNEWHLISGLTVAVFLFISSGFYDFMNENENRDIISYGSGYAVLSEMLPSAHSDSIDSIQMPEHEYLNTIDWEVRQPLDLSTATITTTAQSTADLVHFLYSCGEEQKQSKAVPLEGTVTDSVEWNCNGLITTQIVAVGADTTIEYSYQIDLAFLNSLDP